jgi:hypothetical protein
MEYDDYLKTGTMPPPIESEEERKKKLIASAGGMSVMPPIPMTPAQPSSAPSTANTLPPVPVASRPRSDASETPALSLDGVRAAMDAARGNASPPADVTELSPRGKMLANGARVQPTMPPVKASETPTPPDLGGMKMPPVRLNFASSGPTAPAAVAPATPTGMPPAGKAAMAAPPEAANTMPPVKFDTVGLHPHDIQPAAQTMPPVPVNPQMKAYEDLAAKGAPKPNWWQRALEIAGSLAPFGRAIEEQIPSTPLGYNAKLNQAALRAAREQTLGKGEQERETAASKAQFETPEKRRAYMQKNPDLFDDVSDFEKHDWVLSGKFPQKEPAPEKTTDKKIDEYTNGQGRRVLTFQRSDNSTYDKVGGQTQPKPAGHTSAFEAFAYGSPEEKKAAQDYIDLEKKSAARYKTPSEFDEKFRLFKEDPETYKAMFGDKAGTPDRATATRMLNYFDKRRREVNGDFMLDETQKQEQLRDIENLEKPFMDAVQPGRTDRGGEDRVNVIGPDGTPGTIPRTQLEKAKKKGYREAQ